MTKIGFVFPRFKYPSGDPPVGLAYLAASVLKYTDADVDIIDTTFEDDPVMFLNDHFKKNRYDLLGFSVMTSSLKDAKNVIKIVKKYSPDTKIIFGGPHPTLMPNETMTENPDIDAIAIAEGEQTFVDVINNDFNFEGVKGLWYRNDKGEVIANPNREPIEDLDTIPLPARHLLNMERYINNWYQMDVVDYNLRGTGILASRGCPYNCTFCQPILKSMFGRGMRKRSAKNIVQELKILKETYNINSFQFLDDTFTIYPEWVTEFCDEMINNNMNMKWTCNSRAHLVEKELFKKMKEAGLSRVCIGIESGNQRILNEVYRKGITLDHVKNATRILKELKIKTLGFFMVGAPSETVDEIKQTIRFAKNLDIEEATFSVTTPLPHTTLYEKTKHLIAKDISEFDYYKNPVYQPINGLTPKIITYWKRRALLEFYLHPKRLFSTFKLLASGQKALNKLKRF